MRRELQQLQSLGQELSRTVHLSPTGTRGTSHSPVARDCDEYALLRAEISQLRTGQAALLAGGRKYRALEERCAGLEVIFIPKPPPEPPPSR
jgi:hypothetical protein